MYWPSIRTHARTMQYPYETQEEEKADDDSSERCDEKMHSYLPRKVEIRNPMMMCVGISDYSQTRRSGYRWWNDLPGVKHDMVHMKQLFVDFMGFDEQSFIMNDMERTQEMDEKALNKMVNKVKYLSEERECDALIVIIACHGTEDDQLVMRDGTYKKLSDLKHEVSTKHLSCMAERPKIFVVSACRGSQYPYMATAPALHTRGPPKQPRKEVNNARHYVTMFATAPGLSVIDREDGSVVLNAMDTVMRSVDMSVYHLLDIIAMIDRRASKLCDDFECVNTLLTTSDHIFVVPKTKGKSKPSKSEYETEVKKLRAMGFGHSRAQLQRVLRIAKGDVETAIQFLTLDTA